MAPGNRERVAVELNAASRSIEQTTVKIETSSALPLCRRIGIDPNSPVAPISLSRIISEVPPPISLEVRVVDLRRIYIVLSSRNRSFVLLELALRFIHALVRARRRID